ncbi:efflux transporter outer membrane subunit [Flammeovirga sp. MY04]|uniref:efflux transporter outer membrane subunit n=1 Tax=Flammeovirga sp. MY04 TaxID=1191459 RepID=UPI000A02569F|nr:TolC family protein [Flammeovirga sp. MY04]
MKKIEKNRTHQKHRKMNILRNINFKQIFILLFASQLMWSCKMGKDYQSPDVVTPADYRFGTDTLVSTASDTIAWWELISDPLLDTLIVTALENNQDVDIAMQRIEEAQKLYRMQKVQTRPGLEYAAGVNYGNYSGFVNPQGAALSYYGGAQLNWEIDLWGKNRRLSEAAMADYKGTLYGLRAVQLSVIAGVTEAYIRLLENHASLKVAEETLASRDSSIQIMVDRYEFGYIPEIDLNQAQIQQAIAAASVPTYKRLIALSENSLAVLLGENPRGFLVDFELDDQKKPPIIPAGIPSDLLLRRPDLQRAEHAIMSQNAKVGSAIAQRFPTISLTGFAGAATEFLSTTNSAAGAWNLGAGIVGPLFQWGKNKRRVEVEKARLEASIAEYERSVILAFQEVEDALASVQYYREELIARERHVRAARNAERLSKERYDRGVTSYLEYLEQQRQAFEAELNFINVKSRILVSYIQLYKALGGGWITREEKAEAEQQNN